MSRTSRPVTVTLGPYLQKVEERVASGRYASVSEMIRAGLQALEREEADLDAWARARLEAYDADPRPLVSEEEARTRLKAYRLARLKTHAEKA